MGKSFHWRKRWASAIACLGFALATPLHASNAEYFWDTSPPPGTGQTIPLPSLNAWLLSEISGSALEVDVSALSPGLHQLGIRSRDESGRWSEILWTPVEILDTPGMLAGVTQWPSHTPSLQLAAAEWFWNSEPSQGTGTPINLTPDQTWAIGRGSIPPLDIDISAMPAGIHRLGLRVRDQSGRWSETAWTPVEVSDASSIITAISVWPEDLARNRLVGGEYFWDEDPGRGNGTSVAWSARDAAIHGSAGIPFIDVDASNLTDGHHRLGYRVRSASGTWSATTWIGVEVETGFSRLNPFPTATGGAAAVAWPDVDGDRRPDLFVTGVGPESANRLARNTDVTGFVPFPGNLSALQPSLDGPAGIAWADLDNDGRIDAFLPSATESLSRPGRLVRNLSTGLELLTSPTLNALSSRTFGGAWADFDLDGRVDLVLPNFAGTGGNRLLRNSPSGFVQTASTSLASDLSGARQAAWADFDNDGDPDLLITADAAVGNALFRNDRSNGFIRLPQLLGFTGRGAAWADFDNDGRLDLVVGASGSPAARVFRNGGNDTFQEVPIPALSLASANESAPAWFDYNADGWLDLAVPSVQGLILLQNDRQGGFGSASATAGLSLQSPDGATPVAAATADFDNDGFPDLFVAQSTVRPGWLYRNPGNSNHWLKVSLESDLSNGSAIGSRIEVTATIGGTNLTQTRVVSGGDGGSQSALEALFGMGDASTAARVLVRWPSGVTRSLTNVPADQSFTITELPVIPEITAQPQDQSIPAGTTLSLSVTASGRGTLSHQWFRNGTPLAGATNSTLTASNARPILSGEYTARISNAFAAITSAPARVSIQWQSQLAASAAGSLTGSGGVTTGIAVEDFDVDGWPDVFVCNFGGSNFLFKNQAGATMTVTPGPPTENVNNSQSAAWGDFDNDGWPDLAVVSPGPWGSILAVYRNLSGAGFARLPPSALANLQPWSSVVLWSDLDADGRLDLVAPEGNGGPVRLLRNLGDGTFSEVTTTANLSSVIQSLTAGDADGDGLPDLLGRTVDGQQTLFRNLGGFRFAADRPTGIPSEPETLAWGDFNNDGHQDVFGARADGFTRLYLGNGDGTFTHRPSPDSDSASGRSATPAVADFNQDGWLDVAVTYGHSGGVRLFVNQGDATFRVVEVVPPAPNPFVGAACADVDRNGAPDLIVAGFDGANELLLQNAGSGANWLTVKLRGLVSNRSAIGATIRLRATVDGRDFWQQRTINGGGAYASQSESSQHFGLGDATSIARLRVEWPSGRVTELTNLPVNQALTIDEMPAGTPVVRINGKYSRTLRHEFLTHDPVSVTVESAFPNVFYTTDGSAPDFTSTPYTAAFDVPPPALLRVIAYDAEFATLAEADPVEIVFIESFPILASSPGGGGILLNPPLATFPSNSVVQIIATNAPGWSFLRWEGDLSGSNPTNSFRVSGPTSVRALFATPLNTSVTGGAASGAIALDPTNNPVAFGTTTRLMAVPAPGRYLVRWNLAGSSITTLTNPILAFTVTNASPTLTALFGNLPANQRSLTLRTEGAGSINRSPALAFYTNTSSVSFSAIPEPGWTFDGWAGDLSGTNNPQSLAFTANRTVTARFRFTGIIDPPTFATQPADATRIVGQSVAFDAVVTGSAPLAFQWFSGGTPIPGATLSSLNLGPLSLADSGTYYLIVSNAAASVTSRLAQLTVNPPPNIPPTVTWLSPLGSESFRVPTNIVLLAQATDADGSIQRVDFLLNGALLGSSSAASPSNTFTLTWTNPPAGTNTLSARAVDNQSASVVTTGVNLTVLQPFVTSFSWEFAATSEPERDGFLRLKVLKSGTAAGSVFYETVSSGAEPRKDFLPVAAGLTFAANESEKFVEIPLINEYMPDGPKTFEVRLSNASSGTTLGLIPTTVVTLIDDDAALENNSFVGFFPSASRPSLPGELQLLTEPALAGGQWRLPWDARWRNSGDTITNLDPGPYITEFRPATGFISPATATAAVLANARTRATNVYIADPLQLPGTLRIDLSPLAALQADGLPSWRLVGDSTWLNSGQVRSNLAPGPQVLEFRAVTGWAIPGNLSVLIQSGVDSSLAIEYSPAGDPPAGATPPASLSSYDTIRGGQQLTQKRPYPISGQIRTPHGWASGVAVRDRVLLTAAHVLLDLGTNLVDPASIEWFHERHTGTAGYEPRPIRAKGYYYNTNYLAARIAESQQPGWIPGSSTPASQEWDVAAIFFDEPITRGGQSGYLLSDAFPNVWLASTREKELIGYPITGINDGRLHSTRADNYIFTQVPGTTRVFASASFFSHAGNSGGPLCVLFDRAPSGSAPDPIFFPAAVYLGNYDGLSIVRSIDSMVASLINRAASSATTGENFIDPGPIKPAPNLGTFARFGQIRVRLAPSNVRTLGAGWRFTNSAPFLPDNSVLTLPTGPVALDFKPLAGFRTPATRELSVVANITNEITVTYQPFLPVFPSIADRSVPEGTPFSLPLVATHEASPTPALTFSLLQAPPGASLVGNLLSWSPAEADGPSTRTFVIAVSDGLTSLTNQFNLAVTEANQLPVPTTVPIQTLTNGVPWSFQLAVADPDLPQQPLTFSRISGPANLAVSPAGLVTWTPSEPLIGSTNQVVWAVSDSIDSVTNTFTVVVAPTTIPATPAILSDATLLQDGSIQLSITGATGARYILESSSDLSLWTPIATNTAPFSFTFPTTDPSGASFLRAVSR